MLYDLIAFNIGTYLLAGLLLPLVLVLFWYLWCRERIVLFGFIASVILSVLYALAGSILLYRHGDPAMLAAYGSVGLIDRKSALRDYLGSRFYRLDNERSWKVLPYIDPGWENHLELMNQGALAEIILQSLNTELGQRAASVLDKIEPGWQDGDIGARVGRIIIGRLSNGERLTDNDLKNLVFFESLKLPSVNLANYLTEKSRSIDIVQHLASVLDRMEPGWREGEGGVRVGRSILGRLSNNERLTDNDRKNLEFFEKLKLPSANLVKYLEEQPLRIEVVQHLATELDRMEPGWREGESGVRVGRSILGRLLESERLTDHDRKQLAFLKSLGNFSRDPVISAQIASLFSPRTGSTWELLLPGKVILTMVWIGPGSFQMGSPKSETRRDNDETLHEVRLTKGYWLGKYEITQAQWEAVMGNNPSRFKNVGKDAPVESVSWKDTMKFCRKLTEMERAVGRLPDGYEYSLPTEAQWEYACRAGSWTSFCSGDGMADLNRVGWYSGNSTYPVGKKMANAWGLHDMHGNVSEWCFDRYGSYSSAIETDPVGAYRNANYVMRGGNYCVKGVALRSARRDHASEVDHDISWGFRLALRFVK